MISENNLPIDYFPISEIDFKFPISRNNSRYRDMLNKNQMLFDIDIYIWTNIRKVNYYFDWTQIKWEHKLGYPLDIN